MERDAMDVLKEHKEREMFEREQWFRKPCPDEGERVGFNQDGVHMEYGYRRFQDSVHKACSGTGRGFKEGGVMAEKERLEDTIGLEDVSLTTEQLDDIVPLLRWISFAVIGWKTDLGRQYPGVEDAAKQWAGELLAYIKHPEHDGDCTNQPHTCIRCLVEEARRDAQTVVRFLNGEQAKSIAARDAEWREWLAALRPWADSTAREVVVGRIDDALTLLGGQP